MSDVLSRENIEWMRQNGIGTDPSVVFDSHEDFRKRVEELEIDHARELQVREMWRSKCKELGDEVKRLENLIETTESLRVAAVERGNTEYRALMEAPDE